MDALSSVKPFGSAQDRPIFELRLPGGEVDRGYGNQGNDGKDEANQAQDAKDAGGAGEDAGGAGAARALGPGRASGALGASRAGRAYLACRANFTRRASRANFTRRASRAYLARYGGSPRAGADANAAGSQVHDVSAALLPVTRLLGRQGAYPEGYLVAGALGHQQGIFAVLVYHVCCYRLTAQQSRYLGAGRRAQPVHDDCAMKYMGRDLLG
jgi:hypothetical protein